MARALWKGSIAFGLVSIPVELHTAVRDSRPRFRLLHADDRSPVPPKGGERAYALLREAMRATGLVGIATIVLRDAQHLAALEVAGDAIVLTQMRYPEELVDASVYSFPAAKDPRKPELEMARTLVENLADRWDPTQYTDQYRENLMRIIRARMKGKELKLVEAVEPQQAEVVDLMERLRRSLEAAGGARRKPARGRRTAHKAKRKRTA